MHDQTRQGPTPTLATSAPECNPLVFANAVAQALALLPPVWAAIAQTAIWLDARGTTLRAIDRRLSDGAATGALVIGHDRSIRVYLREIDSATILREAMHVICWCIEIADDDRSPLAGLLAIARETGASLDPDGFCSRWSSLASTTSFTAELAARTLTSPDADHDHPLLHPAHETLWPGSRELLLSAEGAISELCSATLAVADAQRTMEP